MLVNGRSLAGVLGASVGVVMLCVPLDHCLQLPVWTESEWTGRVKEAGNQIIELRFRDDLYRDQYGALQGLPPRVTCSPLKIRHYTCGEFVRREHVLVLP